MPCERMVFDTVAVCGSLEYVPRPVEPSRLERCFHCGAMVWMSDRTRRVAGPGALILCVSCGLERMNQEELG